MKLPTVGCVLKGYPQGTVTQFFAENPKLYAPLGLQGHNGIDISAEWDSPIYAVEGGTVIDVKREPGGFGRQIRIITSVRDGLCRVWVYGHLEQQFVTVGQKIKEGDTIGTMGNTGFVVSDHYANTFWGSSPKVSHPGTHLHLGVRIAKRDINGFSYPGSSIRIKIQNLDNGYKGSVDPIPFLTDSTSVEEKQLETISLLQKVVEFYKQLIALKK